MAGESSSPLPSVPKNVSQYPHIPPEGFMMTNPIETIVDEHWQEKPWNATEDHTRAFNSVLQHKVAMETDRPLSAKDFFDRVKELVTVEQYRLCEREVSVQQPAIVLPAPSTPSASGNRIDTYARAIVLMLDGNFALCRYFRERYPEKIREWFGDVVVASDDVSVSTSDREIRRLTDENSQLLQRVAQQRRHEEQYALAEREKMDELRKIFVQYMASVTSEEDIQPLRPKKRQRRGRDVREMTAQKKVAIRATQTHLWCFKSYSRRYAEENMDNPLFKETVKVDGKTYDILDVLDYATTFKDTIVRECFNILSSKFREQFFVFLEWAKKQI